MIMKEKYVSPSIEVIKMEVEGYIMALSGGGPPTPGMRSSSYRSRSRSTRSGGNGMLSDLEDMISDILQYEK